MSNFESELLSALNENKLDDKTLNKLSKYQSNLMKNYSNPVFNKEDKNKLLNLYNVLQEIGKSIYRYNMLKSNNINVQEEQTNLENIVLKGSISNVKYVWHSEHDEHTCNECLELDGNEFDMFDEVPELPHPNCKCYIEIVEYSDNNSSTEEEPCDCWEKINSLIEEAESWQNEINMNLLELDNIENHVLNSLSEIHFFKNEIKNLQLELTEIEPCCEDCVAYVTGMAINITDDSKLEDIVGKISNLTKESQQVYQIFLEHKKEMESARDGMDKYYHAKANCTSAELGYIQTLWAILYSILKEFKDYFYKVLKYDMDYKEVAKDCLQDLKADWYGIKKAKEHGCCSEKVKNVYNDVF